MGGSSKSVTVGYKYYVGMHLILCHGQADKLIRTRVDGRLAWLGANTGGSFSIDKPDLFGGESREGGISGTIDFETGRNDQTPNSYLVSKLGSLVPAFRGVVGIVLRQVYIGLNPYLKNWDFRVQRVHKRFDGQVQWYDEKAEILPFPTAILNEPWEYQVLPFHSDPGYNNLTPPTSGWQGPAQMPFVSSNVWPYPTPSGWPTPNLSIIWAKKTLYNVTQGLILQIHADNGCVVWINGVVVGASNRDNKNIHSNAQYPVEFLIPSTGTYEIIVKAFSEETTAFQAGNTLYLTLASAEGACMNPAHIIRECLTDPDWGMGYQDADIDDASFIAAADRLYSEGMGMSLLWDTQTSIEEFVKEIVRHIDAALFVDRATGKFVLKLIRDDFDEGSLITLDESNVDKITDFKRPTFGELINAVTVTYWDMITGEDSTITVADIALAQQQGNTNLSSIKYPGFVSSELASRVAQRDLKQLSTPLVSCTIYANLDAENLNIGSVFKLSWGDYDVSELVMRVTGIAYGDGKTNRVRIQCAQDVFSLPENAFIPETPPVWDDPSAAPMPVSTQLAFEVPYLELVQVQRQSAVDNLLTTNPDAGYVGAAAVRPASSALYTRFFSDNGGGYEEIGQVDFSPSAVLAEDISRVQETFEIEDQLDFDQITVGSWFQIGSEIMGYLGITGNVVTVQRGCLDTVPAEHTAGEVLVFWDKYAEADLTEYVSSDNVSIKLCTVTGGGQLALDQAPTSSVDLSSRAIRPYPPGNFKVNNLYFPPELSGPVVATWTTRNRLQQTTFDLIDFFDGPITPEANTTYSLRLLTAGGALVEEKTNISVLTETLTVPSTGNYRLQLFSKRDGYESFQRHDFEFHYSAELQRLSFPLTYDEQDASGAITLSRLGGAPWVTPEGMKGDGYTARYMVAGASLPSFIKYGSIGPLTLHASVKAFDGARQGSGVTARDVIVSVCENDVTANPKLEIAVMNDENDPLECNIALRSYTSAMQVKRLCRATWSYGFRFPQLLDGTNKVRPQACLFLDANTLLISGHYADTKSRVCRIDLPTMTVTGQFDFPTPYVHIASAAFRASDSTYWFGDYATGRLLGVDLAASFAAGTAQITFNNLASAIVGFGSIDWVNISGTDYLLAVEYANTGTRYLYVAPASAFTNGGTFNIASRTKRFVLSGSRMQGVCMEGGKLFVSFNKNSTSTNIPGYIERYNVLTAVASTADGATLTAEDIWAAPSKFVEDLDFHPITGEVWTSTEGLSGVASDDGWLAYWHRPLTSVKDVEWGENHITAEYDGNGKVTVKINNQLFEELSWTPSITPDVVSIGGPPVQSANINGGFFVGTVRRIVLQDQAMTTAQYTAAVAGTDDEPNALTVYNVMLTNPGAETGNVSGWTTEVGTGMTVRAASPFPHTGNWYFTGGGNLQTIARQRVVIAAATGLTTAEIDALAASNSLWARVDWWQSNYDNNDPGSMGIRMLNGTPSELSLSYSGLVTIVTGSVLGGNDWIMRGHVAPVPSGARNTDALIRTDRTAGTNSDSYFDDIKLTFYRK